MKLILVLPYFGKLPNYFKLFLKSAAKNPNIHFLLLTDDKTKIDYPPNFKVIYKTFEEVKLIFQDKFDFKIALDTPFKLCDFKVSYGYVFNDFITGYDHWGHCDPDIIWGNFSNFINNELLNKYDKIFTLGHLTIYKNTVNNNTRFMNEISGNLRYKEVFSKPIGFAFDEKNDKSINTIFQNNKPAFFTNVFVADIDPYKSYFQLTHYNLVKDKYTLDEVKKQIFTWENGGVFRYYIHNGSVKKEEFLYIHLQKRRMSIKLAESEVEKFVIRPNEFVPLQEAITIENFNSYYIKRFIPFQFFKVKFKSLKYKLKYKKHFYGIG